MTSQQSKSERADFNPGWTEVLIVLGAVGTSAAAVGSINAAQRRNRRAKLGAISDRVTFIEHDALSRRSDTMRGVVASCFQYPEGATARQVKQLLKQHGESTKGLGECIHMLRSAQILVVQNDLAAQLSAPFVQELIDHAAEVPMTMETIARYDNLMYLPHIENNVSFLKSLAERFA